MGRLDGKVAIITGSGSGIGKATALLFAKEGAKVVVADFVTEAGEQTVKEIKDGGSEAIFVKTDVTKSEDVKNMVRKAVDSYGKLDVIFNNAGIPGKSNTTADYAEEEWQKIIATNLTGVFLGMKYAIPEMLKSGGGAIINTSSIAADRGIANLPAYCASKGGVSALSRTTALEYATKNIRVNTVNPGTTATPILVAIGEEALKRHVNAIPMGRAADPTEIAHAVLFLASDESSFVTGHSLFTDGGLTIDSRQKG